MQGDLKSTRVGNSLSVPSLILASASTRRAQLLNQLGVPYEQKNPDINEDRLSGETPNEYVRRMAMQKTFAIASDHLKPGVVILAADTVVVVAGEPLGKPDGQADFERMMEMLSDQKHEVLTAVSMKSDVRYDTFVSVTSVWFRALSQREIIAYWKTGEPADKAGGYAIQGFAGAFIRHIEGSYSGVVGLPLNETSLMLTDFGVPWTLSGVSYN